MIFGRISVSLPNSVNLSETLLIPGAGYQVVLKISGNYYSLVRKSSQLLYISVNYVQFNASSGEYIFITEEADQLIKLGAKEYSEGWWAVRSTCKIKH